jgi:CRISPR-associated protein Cas2
VTVIVLVAAKSGLRGHLTRWMVEVSPGVFVGNPSARIRDKIWALICSRIGKGQAVLIRRAPTEQRWVAATAGVDRWTPVDMDGLVLFRRPAAPAADPAA